MHVTIGAVPVLVYPVLQVQITSLVDESCVQIAFESHPPFFTSQESRKIVSYEGFIGIDAKIIACVVLVTFANDNLALINIRVSNFACAFDSATISIECTDRIHITTTVVNFAGFLSKKEKRKKQSSCWKYFYLMRLICLPVHLTMPLVPVLL